MIENRLLAGAVSGLPISLLCLAYVLVRREAVVAAFTAGPDAMPAGAATALAFGTAIFMGPALGVAASLVLEQMPSETSYLGLALALATLMTVAAIAQRTPLMVEKVVLNYAVALVLGVGIPRLLAA